MTDEGDADLPKDQKTCARFSFCWAIRSSNRPCATSASKWMMRWRFQSKPKSDADSAPRARRSLCTAPLQHVVRCGAGPAQLGVTSPVVVQVRFTYPSGHSMLGSERRQSVDCVEKLASNLARIGHRAGLAFDLTNRARAARLPVRLTRSSSPHLLQLASTTWPFAEGFEPLLPTGTRPAHH